MEHMEHMERMERKEQPEGAAGEPELPKEVKMGSDGMIDCICGKRLKPSSMKKHLQSQYHKKHIGCISNSDHKKVMKKVPKRISMVKPKRMDALMGKMYI
jgi:hypothetical protein